MQKRHQSRENSVRTTGEGREDTNKTISSQSQTLLRHQAVLQCVPVLEIQKKIFIWTHLVGAHSHIDCILPDTNGFFDFVVVHRFGCEGISVCVYVVVLQFNFCCPSDVDIRCECRSVIIFCGNRDTKVRNTKRNCVKLKTWIESLRLFCSRIQTTRMHTQTANRFARNTK